MKSFFKNLRCELSCCLIFLACVSLARAEKWSFGVISDTQQSPANARNQSVAVDVVDAINRQFVAAGVDLVLQTGDLTYNDSPAGLDMRAAHNEALKTAGIAFYPVRGNHDGSMAVARHFPKAFPGLPGALGSGRGSSPNLAGAGGLAYAFVHKGVKFIFLDSFNMDDGKGGSIAYSVGDYQPWIDAELAATDHVHAFVLSHKPLLSQAHKDNLFGNPKDPKDPGDIQPQMQNAFFASLAGRKVRYYLCGHDHKHHRAMVESPDGKSRLQQIIGQSDSLFAGKKGVFTTYGSRPPFSPRETPLAQEGEQRIGYYIYSIDGGRVEARYYSTPLESFAGPSPAKDQKTAPEWSLRDVYGCHLNGAEFLVRPGQAYRGLSHAISSGNGFAGTRFEFLDGANTGAGATNDGRPCSVLVSAGWTPKAAAGGMLRSDALTIWGLPDRTGIGQTDAHVLALSFDATGLDENTIRGGGVILASRNAEGQWENAASVKGGGTLRFAARAYDPSTDNHPGTHGVDMAGRVAWAVVDHGGEFAVMKQEGFH
ncbi:MAG: metallophosphoesterase [Verrucomicrobiae bacterium]|nr:metallophosphoesterase [Verrucomicrobiae bacterium]